MGALKTDEATLLFLEYVFPFTNACDNKTVYDLRLCLQKVHVIPCPSGANNALKVGGGGLGRCFFSEVVEGVVAIELHLELLF